MADMKISELSSVASLNNGDLIEVSQVDSSSPTGYSSMKASMLYVGEKVNNNIQYTQDLETKAKTIIGAVNEVNLPLFKIAQFSKTYSISANGRVNFDRSFITIPSGYSIGGIVEATTGQGNCSLVSIRPNNTGVWAFEIVNTSASSYTDQKFTISILFVKTSKVN